MSPRRFVTTMDDPGGLIRDLTLFDRARRFFDNHDVPASFMVVPHGEDGWSLDEQDDWLEALHGAEAEGHDTQLHGLDHAHCEFGPYPPVIRQLGKRDIDEILAEDTAAAGHLWKPEIHREKLEQAIGIFERAMGRRPQVFRTGALSQTPEMYEVAADLGFRYVSNSITDPRGWKYILEEYDNPGDWDPDVPPFPYHLTERLIDLPITSEYAWYLTPEKIERHLALAVDDLRRVYEAGGVFVLVCHVQCVGAEDGLSMELLGQLFNIARREFGVEFGTLARLIADIEEGGMTHGR